MEKVDRLGWAAGIAVNAYGVRVGIRVNDPTALEQLTERLPVGWKPAASSVVDRLYSVVVGGETPGATIRRFHLVYANAVRLARTMDGNEALLSFESSAQLYVAGAAPRRVFVHAGVVSWRGRAIVIPGRSFSGKTTLVKALVQAGATYYSDEYAVFDARGRVHPYPKPLYVREEGGRQSSRCPVEKLGGRAGARPLPVGLVLVSRFEVGGGWRPVPLSPGLALVELVNNAVAIRRKPGAVLAALKQVAVSAPTLKGTRGEAEDVAGSILERAAG